jgi:hypothetical protein
MARIQNRCVVRQKRIYAALERVKEMNEPIQPGKKKYDTVHVFHLDSNNKMYEVILEKMFPSY